MDKKICAIIVTYNRKDLLLRCLDAVCNQTFKCNRILIIDNASTDNTAEAVADKLNVAIKFDTDKRINLGSLNGIEVDYMLKSHNEGGSGGFSMGMQLAHESGSFDGYWMMDDDGYPSADCLEEQVKYLDKYDYVMPVSIDIDNHNQLSWPTVLKEKGKTLFYNELQNSWGEIMEYIYPFNGSLISNKLVDKVGYVDKRLFIWGDEYDHYWRCKEAGFNPVTIINAKFYHPANKMAFVPILCGMIKVPFVDQKWKMVCLARNYTYIYRHYKQKYKIPLKFLVYTWLFLITRKGDFDGWKLYINSVRDGFKEDFTRHLKYLK